MLLSMLLEHQKALSALEERHAAWKRRKKEVSRI